MSNDIAHTELMAIASFQEKGDQEALGRLYKSYMPLVYGVCLKYLKERSAAQDMVMQVYEKLLQKLPHQEIHNFKSWLYVLTKNECLMALRSAQKKNEQSLEDFSQIFMETEQSHHHESEQLENDLNKLSDCIKQLKSAQQVSIKQFYLEKKCYQEIANSTGEELKKVKSHIQNGKRNLKICIEQLREQEQ